MNKQITCKSLVTTIGIAMAGSLAAVNVANAADNPFGIRALDSGYMQLAGETGKEGNGKCGGAKKEEASGKCGGAKKEEASGKCGGAKKEEASGKCGGAKKEEASGKCGGAK